MQNTQVIQPNPTDINELLSTVIMDADIEQIIGIILDQHVQMKRSAWVIAKCFYLVRENDVLFGLTKKNWHKYLSERTGYSALVIKRYANIYDILLTGVPEGIKEDVLKLGVGKLIPLIPLHRKKMLNRTVWDRFLESPKHIPELAKEVSGKLPHVDAVSIRITRIGELYAVRGDGEYIKIGQLDIELITEDDVAKTAIMRIIENSEMKVVK